jgi:hypothetical protein
METNSVIARSNRLSDLVYITKFHQLHRLVSHEKTIYLKTLSDRINGRMINE